MFAAVNVCRHQPTISTGLLGSTGTDPAEGTNTSTTVPLPHTITVAMASAGAARSSLVQLGLDRQSLTSALGLPEHTINQLYRSLEAHARAFKQMVASEVFQLRSVLKQQGGGKLRAVADMLEGPIVQVRA